MPPPGAAHNAGRAAPHGTAGLFRTTTMSQSMGAYLPATAAARVINFGRFLLLTWTMTLEQFGLLNMILYVVNVLTPLCSAGLHDAVTRYVPQHEEQRTLARFARSAFTLLAVISAGVILLMVLFAEPLGRLFFEQAGPGAAAGDGIARQLASPSLTTLTAGVIAMQCIYFFLMALVKGLRMFVALTWLELSHSLLFLAGSGIAVAAGQASAFALTAVYGASIALPVAYFGLRIAALLRDWPGQQERPADPLAGRLLRYSLWAMVAGVTWQALLAFPAWQLNKAHGSAAVGVFGAVRQLAQFILVGAAALSTVVMTTVIKTWESRGPQAAERQWSLAFRACGLGLLMLCGAIALSRDAVMRMFHADYAAAAPSLPLHLLFFLLAAHLAFLPGHFFLREKARLAVWPWAAGLAMNILLAAWLVRPAASPAVLPADPGAPGAPSAGSMPLGVLVTGLSGPQGLDAAAWCAALAMLAATALCALLVRVTCSRLDTGTWIVLAASAALALRPSLLAAVLAALAIVALATSVIFTRDERRQVAAFLREALRHARPS